MSITDELCEIFAEWRDAQNADAEFRDYEKRKNVCKESFDPDGMIAEGGSSEYTGKRILFIAKEGNIGGNSPDKKVHKTDGVFWLQQVVIGKFRQTLFSKRLAMLCNAFHNNNFTVVNKNHGVLKGAAFMNLNKRGGYRYCDWKVLLEYTKRYSEFIRREIETIAPDLIVCCGRGVKYLIDEFVKPSLPAGTKIVEVYHPSYYRVSDKDYLLQFEAELVKSNIAAASHDQTEAAGDTEPCQPTRSDSEIRGFIFDTNAKNDPEATTEMLCCAPLAKISAFGNAARYIDDLRIGDYVFYYLKKVGIIAVGKVVSGPETIESTSERYCDVELVVPPRIAGEGYIAVKVDRELRYKITRIDKRFAMRRTVKYPCFEGEEQVGKAIKLCESIILQSL